MKICSESSRLKVVALFLGVLNCLASTAFSTGVTLSGNIQVNRMRADGSVWEAYNVPFRVSVSDPKWRMITTDSDDHTEYNAFDGTNLYAFWVPSDSTLSRLKREGFASPEAPAYISGNPYPFYNAGPATQVLWFALLSEPFLSSSAGDLPSPWAKFGNMDLNGHLSRLSSLRFNAGSPRWPVEAQFVYSSRSLLDRLTNIAFLSSHISPDQIKKKGRDTKKLDDHPAAQYKVLSTTNFGDKTFPLSFEFDVLEEKGPEPLKLWVMESFIGAVTSISGEVPEDLVPKPPVRLAVSDFRFSDRERRIDDLRYSITNGVWPTIDDPKLQEAFRKLRASTPVYREVALWKVRLMFLIVILLAGLPLVFASLKGRRKSELG